MSLIAGVFANWRVIAGALAIFAIAGAGFYVKAKFARAAEADRLEAENTMLEQNAALVALAYKKADQDRVLMSAQIADYQEQLRVDVQTVIKRVPVYIKDDRQCDIPVEVLKDLNRAMGHQEE